eukprot:925401_1
MVSYNGTKNASYSAEWCQYSLMNYYFFALCRVFLFMRIITLFFVMQFARLAISSNIKSFKHCSSVTEIVHDVPAALFIVSDTISSTIIQWSQYHVFCLKHHASVSFSDRLKYPPKIQYQISFRH